MLIFSLRENPPRINGLPFNKENFMVTKQISKHLINTLKTKVNDISSKNPDIKTVTRNLKALYKKNISEQKLSFDTYLTITAYLIIYRSLITSYRVS